MRPIEALVFDRDGVLTDFDFAPAVAYLHPLIPLGMEELAARWEAWGATQGFPRSLAEEATFFHGYWNAIADEVGASPAVRARLLAFDYTTCMRAYPDARPALAWARAQGCRIGVLSNFSLASLEPSLVAAGLGDLVDVACAATVIGAAKPQPAAYLAVCRLLKVAPEAALFFDDEVACVEGARQVGMRAWLVTRTRGAAALQEGIVGDLTALPEIWQRLAQ